jgi:hypothetical protein
MTPRDTWPRPDTRLIDDDRPPAPLLHDDALPAGWGVWISDEAAARACPRDYVAAGLIAAASAWIGNARRVMATADWIEPAHLWFALIGVPSTGKTPALRPLIEASRSWSATLNARLDPNSAPVGDVPPRRWLRFIDDCGRFLDGGWALRAADFGWGPLDLFGCDRERPFARLNHMGLLWLLNGGALVELHRDRAIIETASGVRQSYERRPVEVGRVVLAWELNK